MTLDGIWSLLSNAGTAFSKFRKRVRAHENGNPWFSPFRVSQPVEERQTVHWETPQRWTKTNRKRFLNNKNLWIPGFRKVQRCQSFSLTWMYLSGYICNSCSHIFWRLCPIPYLESTNFLIATFACHGCFVAETWWKRSASVCWLPTFTAHFLLLRSSAPRRH